MDSKLKKFKLFARIEDFWQIKYYWNFVEVYITFIYHLENIFYINIFLLVFIGKYKNRIGLNNFKKYGKVKFRIIFSKKISK